MFVMSPSPGWYHTYIIVIVFNEAAVTMFAMSPSPGQPNTYIVFIGLNEVALTMFAMCQDRFSTDLSSGIWGSGFGLALRPECCIAGIALS